MQRRNKEKKEQNVGKFCRLRKLDACFCSSRFVSDADPQTQAKVSYLFVLLHIAFTSGAGTVYLYYKVKPRRPITHYVL